MRTACPASSALPGLRRGMPALRTGLPEPPGHHDIADPLTGGSVAGFVLEGELELGAIGDGPALVQGNVLLDDFGHPQIAESPGGGPDRLRGRVRSEER